MATKRANTRAERERKARTLVIRRRRGQTTERAGAELMVEGVGMNAVVSVAYSPALGTVDLTESMAALLIETQHVQAGRLSGMEAVLAAQAVTLNAMFTHLARQASGASLMDHMDRYTRLALKAQSQCRATVETLALMKNPPTVFARQANIAHGPQQVNNGTALSRARDSESGENELLEAAHEQLDTEAARKAGDRDPILAPVGAVDRAQNH